MIYGAIAQAFHPQVEIRTRSGTRSIEAFPAAAAASPQPGQGIMPPDQEGEAPIVDGKMVGVVIAQWICDQVELDEPADIQIGQRPSR